jgi:hypothetical protein
VRAISPLGFEASFDQAMNVEVQASIKKES